jgi:hypothetical protein
MRQNETERQNRKTYLFVGIVAVPDVDAVALGLSLADDLSK